MRIAHKSARNVLPALMQELRAAFENESVETGQPRLLLTVAVAAGKSKIDVGYDVPVLNRYKCTKRQFIHLLTATFKDLHIENSKNYKR